jgi:hypothetical protein
MVTVYLFESDLDGFGLLNCDDDAIRYINQGQFDGTPIGSSWRPFRVWWDPNSSTRDLGDFPGFPEPVVSGRVVEALGDVLRRHGELLELLSDDGEFYIYNVTDVADALDEAASSGERFSSGRYMHIQKRVFRPDVVGKHELFKIPQLRNEVHCTDAFRTRVEEAGLRGFAPVELWSERGGSRWYGG